MSFSRAKTVRGLVGNVKFITKYKSWATLAIFLAGVLFGYAGRHYDILAEGFLILGGLL